MAFRVVPTTSGTGPASVAAAQQAVPPKAPGEFGRWVRELARLQAELGAFCAGSCEAVLCEHARATEELELASRQARQVETERSTLLDAEHRAAEREQELRIALSLYTLDSDSDPVLAGQPPQRAETLRSPEELDSIIHTLTVSQQRLWLEQHARLQLRQQQQPVFSPQQQSPQTQPQWPLAAPILPSAPSLTPTKRRNPCAPAAAPYGPPAVHNRGAAAAAAETLFPASQRVQGGAMPPFNPFQAPTAVPAPAAVRDLSAIVNDLVEASCETAAAGAALERETAVLQRQAATLRRDCAAAAVDREAARARATTAITAAAVLTRRLAAVTGSAAEGALAELPDAEVEELCGVVTNALHRAIADRARRSLRAGGTTATSAEMSLCVVCLEREKQVRLEPCGHGVLCSVCAARLDACPTCRAHITQRQRLFL
eukprot:TRINITY_DN9601_c0_g1_i1.p1 TRINITY_DN9601_c0_g1~~TRINITY_DN9601_c0_g1_i1.p1  ORF type:complete len:457 (+),score=84.93 TRINITY_DN9601_c0_g1_i1:82-1371(+)